MAALSCRWGHRSPGMGAHQDCRMTAWPDAWVPADGKTRGRHMLVGTEPGLTFIQFLPCLAFGLNPSYRWEYRGPEEQRGCWSGSGCLWKCLCQEAREGDPGRRRKMSRGGRGPITPSQRPSLYARPSAERERDATKVPAELPRDVS